VRETRTHGSEGGESGLTGLPYPYRGSRVADVARLPTQRFMQTRKKAKVALAVNHDQQALYAVIRRALLQVTEVCTVLGFVREKLVDVLDGVDAELFFRDFRKIGNGQLLFVADGAVERPLGKRNLEWSGLGCHCERKTRKGHR